MGKKDLFVFLFPEKEYMKNENQKLPSLLDKCIRKRYINNNYEFGIIKYKNSQIYGIKEIPDKIVETDISFEESTPYHTEVWRYADFEKLANGLMPEKYSSIRIGGYHCLDCVKRLALESYKRNAKSIVDTDLTEFFSSRVLQLNRELSQQRHELHYEINPDFNFENYSTTKTFNEMIRQADSMEYKRISDTYGHPIYGMTKSIEQLMTQYQRSQDL